MKLEVTRSYAASSRFLQAHGLVEIGAGAVVELEDASGSGGFGAVHKVRAVDGSAPPQALVAKVFLAGGLVEWGGNAAVVPRIRALHEALEAAAPVDWPNQLLAVPFAVVAARVEGREEVVTFMLDLAARGYETPPLIDKIALKRFRGADPRERLDFALSFARQAALLESVSFLHGDLNPENLLFDFASRSVQIIDLDAGAVVVTGDEHPLSPGKFGDCMPPEVKGSGLSSLLDIEKYTLAAERWSIGSLVGRILFGIHPGFFLRAMGHLTLGSYAKLGPCWPEIDENGALFTKEPANRSAYPSFKQRFEAAPGTTRELFARFFAAGLHGIGRPSAREWVEALEGAQEPPRFVSLEVDRDLIAEGEEIVISWTTANADCVAGDEVGTQDGNGSVRVALTETKSIELTAVSAYGRDSARTPVVRVVSLPALERIPLPQFPGLELTVRATMTALPQLSFPTVQLPRVSRVSPAAPLPSRAVPHPLPLPPSPRFSAVVPSFHTFGKSVFSNKGGTS